MKRVNSPLRYIRLHQGPTVANAWYYVPVQGRFTAPMNRIFITRRLKPVLFRRSRYLK
jgi:hypothetical protein